jgi:hypothetical protein
MKIKALRPPLHSYRFPPFRKFPKNQKNWITGQEIKVFFSPYVPAA